MEQVIKESVVPDQKHGKAVETIYGVGVMFVQRTYPAFVIGRPLDGLALRWLKLRTTASSSFFTPLLALHPHTTFALTPHGIHLFLN